MEEETRPDSTLSGSEPTANRISLNHPREDNEEINSHLDIKTSSNFDYRQKDDKNTRFIRPQTKLYEGLIVEILNRSDLISILTHKVTVFVQQKPHVQPVSPLVKIVHDPENIIQRQVAWLYRTPHFKLGVEKKVAEEAKHILNESEIHNVDPTKLDQTQSNAYPKGLFELIRQLPLWQNSFRSSPPPSFNEGSQDKRANLDNQKDVKSYNSFGLKRNEFGVHECKPQSSIIDADTFDGGPIAAMKSVDPNAAAGYFDSKNNTDFEWIHLIGFSLNMNSEQNNANTPNNLVLGTSSMKAFMLQFETVFYDIIKSIDTIDDSSTLKKLPYRITMKGESNLFLAKLKDITNNGNRCGFTTTFSKLLHLSYWLRYNDSTVLFGDLDVPLFSRLVPSAIEQPLLKATFTQDYLDPSLIKKLDDELSSFVIQSGTPPVSDDQPNGSFRMIGKKFPAVIKGNIKDRKITEQYSVQIKVTDSSLQPATNKLLHPHPVIQNIINSMISINKLEIIGRAESGLLEYRFSGTVADTSILKDALDYLNIKELPNLVWIIKSDGELTDRFYQQQHYYLESSVTFQDKKMLTQWIELKDILVNATLTPGGNHKTESCDKEIGLGFTAWLQLSNIPKFQLRGSMQFSQDKFYATIVGNRLNLDDYSLTLKSVQLNISKEKNVWDVGMSATTTIGNLVFYLSGTVRHDNQTYFGIFGQIPTFSLDDFNMIYNTYSNLGTTNPYNITFKNVVVSLSTSTESMEVMSRNIPSGFGLSCDVEIEGYDFLPKSISVFVNISQSKIVFRGDLKNFSIKGLDIGKAYLNLELSKARKDIEVGGELTFQGMKFMGNFTFLKVGSDWTTSFVTILSNSTPGGDLLKLQFITIKDIGYIYDSNPYSKKSLITAHVTKIAKWDTDFSLSYDTSQQTIRVVARTPPSTKISDSFLKNYIRIDPFTLILGLIPDPLIGIEFPFSVISKDGPNKSFSIKLMVSASDIRGSVDVDLGQEWNNPLGICDLLNISSNFIAIDQKIGFGFGLIYQSGLPDYLRFEGGIRLDQMKVRTAFEVNLNPSSPSFKLDTQITGFKFEQLVDSFFYMLTSKKLIQIVKQQFKIFSIDYLRINLDARIKQVMASSLEIDAKGIVILGFLEIEKANLGISSKGLHCSCDMKPFSLGGFMIEPTPGNQSIKFAIDVQSNSFYCSLSGMLKIYPLVQAGVSVAVNKDNLSAQANVMLPLGYMIDIGIQIVKNPNYLRVSFFGYYTNGKSKNLEMINGFKDQIAFNINSISPPSQMSLASNDTLPTDFPEIEYQQNKRDYLDNQIHLLKMIKEHQKSINTLKEMHLKGEVGAEETIKLHEQKIQSLLTIYHADAIQSKYWNIKEEHYGLMETKRNLASSLTSSFFRYLWEKVKSAFNYIVDVAKKVVNVIKSVLPQISYIQAVCDLLIHNNNPDYYFLFEIELELTWLSYSKKIHLKLQHGADKTIAAQEASDKSLEEMIQRAKMESYSQEAVTTPVGRPNQGHPVNLETEGYRISFLREIAGGISGSDPPVRMFRMFANVSKFYPKSDYIAEMFGVVNGNDLQDVYFGYDDVVEYVKIGQETQPQFEGAITYLKIKKESMRGQIIFGTDRNFQDEYPIKHENRFTIEGLLKGLRTRCGEYIEQLSFVYLREPPIYPCNEVFEKIAMSQKVGQPTGYTVGYDDNPNHKSIIRIQFNTSAQDQGMLAMLALQNLQTSNKTNKKQLKDGDYTPVNYIELSPMTVIEEIKIELYKNGNVFTIGWLELLDSESVPYQLGRQWDPNSKNQMPTVIRIKIGGILTNIIVFKDFNNPVSKGIQFEYLKRGYGTQKDPEGRIAINYKDYQDAFETDFLGGSKYGEQFNRFIPLADRRRIRSITMWKEDTQQYQYQDCFTKIKVETVNYDDQSPTVVVGLAQTSLLGGTTFTPVGRISLDWDEVVEKFSVGTGSAGFINYLQLKTSKSLQPKTIGKGSVSQSRSINGILTGMMIKSDMVIHSVALRVLKKNNSYRTCPNGHQIIGKSQFKTEFCYKCHETDKTIYGCQPCNYFVCSNCYSGS